MAGCVCGWECVCVCVCELICRTCAGWSGAPYRWSRYCRGRSHSCAPTQFMVKGDGRAEEGQQHNINQSAFITHTHTSLSAPSRGGVTVVAEAVVEAASSLQPPA